MDWLAKVRRGEFNSIPTSLTWEAGGRQIAGLINGYELAQFITAIQRSTQNLNGREAACHVNREVRNCLGYNEEVDAIALWTAMFFEARRERFLLMPADVTCQVEPMLEKMCAALHRAVDTARSRDLEILKKNIKNKLGKYET